MVFKWLRDPRYAPAREVGMAELPAFPPVEIVDQPRNTVMPTIPESAASGGEVPDQLSVSQQQDTFYKPSQETASEPSGLPRVKVPKTCGRDQVGIDQDINADVFHSPVSGDQAASDGKGQSEKEDMEKLGTIMAEDAAAQEVC